MVRALGRRQFPLRTVPACARRFASTEAEKKTDAFSDLDSASSFTTPSPDEAAIETFNAAEKARSRDNQLPGNRSVSSVELCRGRNSR